MMTDSFFVLFAVLAVGGALAMVISRNPVASLMYLVLSFFALSGLFVLLDAHFLAAVNVILYAGAILVLFLFVIMLLNLGHLERADVRGWLYRTAALAAAGALFALAVAMVQKGRETVVGVGMSETGMEALLRSRGAVGAVADPLYRNYMVPFEITSLLLLVAIVGAIVLARRRAP